MGRIEVSSTNVDFMSAKSEGKKPTPWFRILIILWLLGLGWTQERQRQEIAALRFHLEQQQALQQTP
jgi:hypothetical protein